MAEEERAAQRGSKWKCRVCDTTNGSECITCCCCLLLAPGRCTTRPEVQELCDAARDGDKDLIRRLLLANPTSVNGRSFVRPNIFGWRGGDVT
eukprot:m.107550 g.107550  ORF g.107550 m.107550 type:complete len:93 (-) comp15854_c0_seq2:140-418(-)